MHQYQDLLERILSDGAEKTDRTPAALGTLVKNEIAKWTPVLKPVN